MRNTISEKTENLHQSRIAFARIVPRRSFAINMIRTATGSRRLLKPPAGQSGVSSAEPSVTFKDRTRAEALDYMIGTTFWQACSRGLQPSFSPWELVEPKPADLSPLAMFTGTTKAS